MTTESSSGKREKNTTGEKLLIIIGLFALAAIGAYTLGNWFKFLDTTNSRLNEIEYSVHELRAGMNLETIKQRTILFARAYVTLINPDIDPAEAYDIAELNYKLSLKYPSVRLKDALAIQGIESHFKKDAISHVGAKGVWQMMPTTLELVAEARGWTYNEEMHIENFEEYLECGWVYADKLTKRYGSDFGAFLAHWNGGGRAVYWYYNDQSKMPEETRNFIDAVLSEISNL